MNTRNARALVLVIGFCAVIAVLLYGGYGAKVYIDNALAAQRPDSPKVAEILGGFAGVAEATAMIPTHVTCQSEPIVRETAVSGVDATASELDRLVKQSRELLQEDRTLSGKDRSLLAERTAMAASAASTLRGASKGLRACATTPSNTL